MPNKRIDPKIEPCPDCPIPPSFVFNYRPAKDGQPARCDVECRECDDKWTEILDEE